ncbi:thioredoxin fold domain-containing protein [Chitinophaga sp.]|uniref:thioredoxin family protein n=1 Tax=Chitinophaga sp. TaxID=1869181 RepID=UPI0031D96A9D
MKKILFLTLIVIPTVTISAQEKKINFLTIKNLEEATSKAKSEGKLIFIDVYATWCSPCKKMEKEVFTSESVYTYINRNFIPIRIQIDKNPNDTKEIINQYNLSKEISTKYKIKSIPTYLFIDSNQELIHKDDGFMTIDSLLDVCKIAKENTNSYSANMNNLRKGKTQNIDLLKFAIDLSRFGEDSLAGIAAQLYKSNVIDKTSPDELLTPKLNIFMQKFGKLFTATDSIVKWMYSHKTETDKRLESPGYATIFTDYVIKKDILHETINTPSPSWELLEKELSKKWDKKIAKSAILDAKIKWYTNRNDWNNAIKYQMDQIEQNTDTQKKLNLGEIFMINNFVYDIVLKKSNDTGILKKAISYMQVITIQNPNNTAIIDTYANVLYKIGKRNEAIEMEQKALNIAENKNSIEDKKEFEETIRKMKMNIPTWD